jgi:acyl-CoA synthetase (AMP-forming)/AMP-acid ligase II/thioesterase domain-containing protein
MAAGTTTIRDRIDHWAQTRTDSPALVDSSWTLDYGGLATYVARCAVDLAHVGLGKGCRVGVMAAANVAGARVMLAVACNCVLVPVSAALPAPGLAALVNSFGLDALVVGDDVPHALQESVLSVGVTVLRYGDEGLDVLVHRPAPAPERIWELRDVALLLRSSGTTGQPKVVAVTHGNMLEMARKLSDPRWLALGPEDRTAGMLPLHYAAGLKNVLLVPAILGASVAFPPPGEAFAVDTWLDQLRPTYLCTAPATLRALVERLRGKEARLTSSSLRYILCSSTYLPEDLRAAAEERCGVPVLEFYGLSEAGVMAANPPRHAVAGTVGLAAAGELSIVDEAGRELAAGEEGEIVVRGPSLSPGYVEGDALAGEQVGSGCLHTGDIGWLDDDGYLNISGRSKEVINRGGEKVFPYEVEKALLAHPDVLEAAVFGVPHPRLGEAVAAAVVPLPGKLPSAHDLMSFLTAGIAHSKIPGRIRVLPELPRGPTGKVLRNVLAEQHVQESNPMPTRALSLIELEIRHVWQRLLGRNDIDADDDFQDKGGDSLLAADMLLEVEQIAGVSLHGFSPSVLTIRAIADAVADALPVGPAMVTRIKQGSGMPLCFCHGDHAGRGMYAQRLAAHLPKRRPLVLLNATDDDGLADIETAAAAYVPEVLRAAGSSPVFIGGYCNAGMVAWHLAYLLRMRGVEVAGLVLVETVSLNGDRGLRVLARTMRQFGKLLPGHLGVFVRNEAMRGFWVLKRKGLRRLIEVLRTKPFTALPLAAGRHARHDRLELNLYRRMARYVPPPLDVPLTCVIAEEESPFDTDPSRWRPWVPAVEVFRIPGSHASAVVTHREALAQALERAMRADGKAGSVDREVSSGLPRPT